MGKLLSPANVSYSCYTGDTLIMMTDGSSAGISYHGFISLSQIRVQAFDIKNVKNLSPDEELLSKMVYKTPEYPTLVGTSYGCQPPTTVDVQAKKDTYNCSIPNSTATNLFVSETVTDCPVPTPLPIDYNDHTGIIEGVPIAVFFVIMVLVGIYIYRRRETVVSETVTSCPAPTPLPTDDDDHRGTTVGVVIAVFLVIMVLAGIYIYRRRGKVSYEQVY
uniref:Uncharacterized protein n=1 Tax=Magallana gigas TaxID=29159 RepID=A0A8W8IS49_MAGGI